MIEFTVAHKGSGKKYKGQEIKAPSYRQQRQVQALVSYCLSPARGSGGQERVALVMYGSEAGQVKLTKSSMLAAEITASICSDIPEGRRLLRHVVVSLRGGTLEEQRQKLPEIARAFADEFASGHDWFLVGHDDHAGDARRGLHGHLLLRNCDGFGSAIDWSPSDLKRQQSGEWCSHLDVVSSKGRGTPLPKSQSLPYPKAKQLDARKIGELTNEQLEKLIGDGDLSVGRRNKGGVVTSVIFKGRRIRLSTARGLAERARVVGTGSSELSSGREKRRGDRNATCGYDHNAQYGKRRRVASERANRISRRRCIRRGRRRRSMVVAVGRYCRAGGLLAAATRQLTRLDTIGRIL